ncbi:MAG: acyltransferase [Clostridia bacterium]|nr:acyltransferase [Clostridia bacterium]
MNKLIKLIMELYWRFFTSPERYAKHLGVDIGTNNLIKKMHWSSEPYLIKVGSNCQLTNCRIFTHGGGQVVRDEHPEFDVFGKVTIGNWVYIGTNSLIMPGVTIGDNVLIAAGSVVTKSIPNRKVVAGNPARIICSIDEYYERNKMYDQGTKGLDDSTKRGILLNAEYESFLRK